MKYFLHMKTADGLNPLNYGTNLESDLPIPIPDVGETICTKNLVYKVVGRSFHLKTNEIGVKIRCKIKNPSEK